MKSTQSANGRTYRPAVTLLTPPFDDNDEVTMVDTTLAARLRRETAPWDARSNDVTRVEARLPRSARTAPMRHLAATIRHADRVTIAEAFGETLPDLSDDDLEKTRVQYEATPRRVATSAPTPSETLAFGYFWVPGNASAGTSRGSAAREAGTVSSHRAVARTVDWRYRLAAAVRALVAVGSRRRAGATP